MKLLCLLVLVGAAAATSKGPPKKNVPKDPLLDIDMLQTLTEELESGLQALAKNISDATTLGAVGEDELNEIYDFFIPSINNKNAQQSALIASYQAQVKALQHKVDDAKSQEKEAISLAQATMTSVVDQINNYLNGSGVKGVNDAQEVQIDNTDNEFNTVRTDFNNALDADINNLNNLEAAARAKVNTLAMFVASRKCEYGFSFVPANTPTDIDFKTPFAVAPNVSTVLTGFKAGFDKYQYVKFDELNINTTIVDTTTDKFTVNGGDFSIGTLILEYVSISWMACQNLDGQMVDLAHP